MTMVTTSPSVRAGQAVRVLAMPALLVVALALTKVAHPDFGSFDVQSLALGALPLALAAAAQTIVVISGGIDLSVGSSIAVANVLSASLMHHASFTQSLFISLLVLAVGAGIGLINGLVVAVSRIPDVVATLTAGFIWGGVALLILERPGGGAPAAYLNLASGQDFGPWVPNALLVMIVAITALWLPIRFTRIGLLIYAAGSDPVAAFRSGVNVRNARTIAYVFSGIACAVGGMDDGHRGAAGGFLLHIEQRGGDRDRRRQPLGRTRRHGWPGHRRAAADPCADGPHISRH
jgi:ribose transport system permease protein